MRRRDRRHAVQAVLEQVALDVARLPTPAFAALWPVLQQAERELARDLARWLRAVPGGDARFTAQQYRVALVQLRRALRVMQGLNPALYNVLAASQRAAGDLAIGHLARQVERFSWLFEGSVRPVALDPAVVLAQGETLLLRRFRRSAKRYGEHVIADIQRQLAVGVVRGETFAQLTRRLQRLRPTAKALAGMARGEVASADELAAVFGQRMQSRALLIVRTEAINAYNVHADAALLAAEEEDPGYLRRWDASLDWRACPICRALDGQVVELDGTFPGGHRHPPAHPQCRCALTPWRLEWGEPVRSAPGPRPPAPPEVVSTG